MSWDSQPYAADPRNFDPDTALDEELRLMRVQRGITHGPRRKADIAYDITQKQAYMHKIETWRARDQPQGPCLGLKLSSRQNVYITFDNEGDALVEYKRGQSVDWDTIEQVLRPLRHAELGFSSAHGGGQRKRPKRRAKPTQLTPAPQLSSESLFRLDALDDNTERRDAHWAPRTRYVATGNQLPPAYDSDEDDRRQPVRNALYGLAEPARDALQRLQTGGHAERDRSLERPPRRGERDAYRPPSRGAAYESRARANSRGRAAPDRSPSLLPRRARQDSPPPKRARQDSPLPRKKEKKAKREASRERHKKADRRKSELLRELQKLKPDERSELLKRLDANKRRSASRSRSLSI